MNNSPMPSNDENLRLAERQKDFYRGISFDMSPAAIDRRLKIVGGLYRLAQELKHSKLLGPGDAFQYANPVAGPPLK